MAKILITDDSLFQRNMLKNTLSTMGHEIVEASSGKEALEKLKLDTFDLITLDLLMPEMTGTELLKSLKTINSSTPVIIISADIQTTRKDECMALGARAFLNKPIEKEKLASTINEIFSHAQ